MVIFGTDGLGKWWKTEYPEQCKHRVMLQHKCQGAHGHVGEHWTYTQNGTYAWHHNDADGPMPKTDSGYEVAAGKMTPSCKSYTSPPDKINDYFMSMSVYCEVTDPTEIARLEAGNTTDDEIITRPCSDAEINELQNSGILKS